MKPILLITTITLLYSCSYRARSNNYKLTQLVRQIEDYKVKKILLVGNGDVGTRYFLDNLFEVLKQELEKHHVDASYEFLGHDDVDNKKLKTLLSRERYDAILQFKTADDAMNPIVVSEGDIPLRNGNIGVRSIAVRFTQNFVINFYKKHDFNSIIWKASLSTNLDSRKKRFYTNLAGDIIRACSEIIKR